jgi:uncharacterized sulfatase
MNLKELSLLTLASAGTMLNAQTREKPNIIFILIDDMGYPAIECYGNKMVKTPHIDQIAKNGIKFTQGYVTPQSTPTRASLLTGQYTARNKMWHVIPGYGFPYARVQEPEYLEELPHDQFTVAEALKTAGYTTACIGKWHLSRYENDGYYTYLYPEKAHFYGFDYVNPRTDPSEYQSYGDKGVDFLTNEAIGFMDRNRSKPFFLYLSHHTVHNPILAPKDMVKKYLDKGYPEKGLNFAEYLASIEHLDNSVGRLMTKLSVFGLEKNTLVFFVSDNGGVDSQFDNAPLRYSKGSAYEGGTRVPFMVQWPDKIKPGQVSDFPVHIIDIYPTLLDIVKAPRPKRQVLDGRSMLPVLTGNIKAAKKFHDRPIFFYQPLYDIQWGAVPSASMVKGDYKILWFFGDYVDLDHGGKYIPEGRVELYNLKSDIGEKNDLAKVEPARKEKMLSELRTWINSTGSPIPELNPDFDTAKWNQRANSKKEE